MRRWELSSIALVVALGAPLAICAQTLTHEGRRWTAVFNGRERAPAGSRLQVAAPGAVTLKGGATDEVQYTLRVTVEARNEAEARRLIEGIAVRPEWQGNSMMLTVLRRENAFSSSFSVRAPSLLREAVVATASGPVFVGGIDGSLTVDSAAGAITADHIRGHCRLVTGGGAISVGQVDGSLQCATGGGPITVKRVRGTAVLETAGGDIVTDEAGGPIRATTAGGSVRITSADSSVSASTGGGLIWVGRATGIVTARNVAGPVQVGAAAGVHCESGTGGIRVSNVSGSLLVSTAMGNIIASLMGGKLADSSLSTGDGDITVLIPSNVGVTIRAENDMSDTIRRIISDFPGIPIRMYGTQVVAEGPVNGGGPILRISGTGGTIFIRRQQ
ncbi:MAG TPA: hypothetical protein VG675_05510 [Bryobacteraceae bacterium]|nr:hypothetical protein [Bryobacteraceae bacterium]